MVATKVLNQYKASFQDLSERTVAALTMSDALEVLQGSGGNAEPSIMQIVGKGITVAVPDPAVELVTAIQEQAAIDGKCYATPYSAKVLHNGDKVFLTAIPGEGFSFAKWQDEEGNTLSEDASYEYTVAYDGETPAVIKVCAKFTAQP